MTNSWDLDGRGPSDRHLLAYGCAALLVLTAVVASLTLKSTGRLDDYVRIVADLNDVGDGLPQHSDVKYHGLLVGTLDDVIPAADGKPNYVHLDLKARYAKDIPATVTARVVPSNIFAVSSVQLVDRGDGATAIRNGAHIAEDTELPTVIFETTISKLREILAATARGGGDRSVGVLAAIEAATENRGTKLLTAGAQLTRQLHELNDIVATDAGPSTISALTEAARGLQATAPELVDALHEAVKPMQTFAETRSQLTALVAGSQHTLGVSRSAFDNHTDQLIQIARDLTPVLGVFALHGDKFATIFTKVNQLSDKFFQEVWDPDHAVGNMRINFALTPTYTYTRADCPRYGQLAGPSCFTAPLVEVRPDLPATLLPQNYQPPPDLAPPPGTVIGPDGNLVAVGPPLVNGEPNLTDPNARLPVQPFPVKPAPRVPGTADPADAPPITAPPNPAALPAEVAPASYGGNVGPVGSEQERDQLGVITGQDRPASVATQLLLGPIARGTTASVTTRTPGGPK
jgi:ABC-type transporter Mla subunit MlaD